MAGDCGTTAAAAAVSADARDRVLQPIATEHQRGHAEAAAFSLEEKAFQRRVVSDEVVGGVTLYRLNGGRVAADLAGSDGKRLEFATMEEMLRHLRLARSRGVTLTRYSAEPRGT